MVCGELTAAESRQYHMKQEFLLKLNGVNS